MNKEKKKELSENDMALIEFDDGSRDIIRIIELNNRNFSNLNIGKKYSFKFENKWNLVRLKFIGTWEDCHQEFEKISEMEESEKNKSTQNVSINQTGRFKNSDIVERIKQLELALIEKEIKIQKMEKKLQEQEEINLALKNTFSDRDIAFLKQASINFLKIFGNNEETEESSENENLINFPVYNTDCSILSKNFPDVTLPLDVKYKVQSYLSNPNETPSSAFRKVITALIPDSEEWATSNRILIVDRYKDQVHASYEYVKMFKPGFDYNAAEAELRKIASERRRDLKKIGYIFETYKDTNETFCRYRIVHRPFVAENQDCCLDELKKDISHSFNDTEYYDENFQDDFSESSKRQKMCDHESD
ncbi:hypothetical protein BpHYR1_035925 [Brachionus plicatilis]|uniref:Uncharacterized protein n=1 Tax=Brachionus plicatilis TaxID=10195 RepID=A0A3M7QSP1_BRAPC|nr:hypothetical protein BpHYR1_035925 [Brachionus plicatilis]